jgi:DNA-binding HxlR family transcriptional regulator
MESGFLSRVSKRIGTSFGVGTQMFLIAPAAQDWHATVPVCEKGVRNKIGEFDEKFSQEAERMNTIQGPKLAPSIFIGRWTPKILFSLKERPYRHGQLRRHLGSVSQRMLTRTLRHLESAGLIAKRVTKSNAIAVEYSLTQLGRTLIAPLRGMCRWAIRYRRDISADVPLREAETT